MPYYDEPDSSSITVQCTSNDGQWPKWPRLRESHEMCFISSNERERGAKRKKTEFADSVWGRPIGWESSRRVDQSDMSASVLQCDQATPAWKGWLTGRQLQPNTYSHTQARANLVIDGRRPCRRATLPSRCLLLFAVCKKQNHCKKWLLERKAQAEYYSGYSLVLWTGGRMGRWGKEAKKCSVHSVPSQVWAAEWAPEPFATFTHSHYLLSRATPIRLEHCQSLLSFSLAPIEIVCQLSRRQ